MFQRHYKRNKKLFIILLKSKGNVQYTTKLDHVWIQLAKISFEQKNLKNRK